MRDEPETEGFNSPFPISDLLLSIFSEISERSFLTKTKMKNLFILTIALLISGFANAQCKVYSGSSGYTVAARVEDGKVYSGSSGYTVVARFENGKVYSGAS